MLSAALVAVLTFVASLTGQIRPPHVAVLTRLAGPATCQILDVDPATGTVVPFGRFPSDTLPPLAIALDWINLDAIVAVDLGGSSRIVRLGAIGNQFVGERHLADLAGTCTGLAVRPDGQIFVAIDGPQGGVWLLPRNGGVPAQTIVRSDVAAIDLGGPHLGSQWMLAQHGNPPSSFHVQTGQQLIASGSPTAVSGVCEASNGGQPTHLLLHPNGTLSRIELTTFPVFSMTTTSISLSPPLPPGGAVAMKVANWLGADVLVLGGVASPFLVRFNTGQVTGPAPSPTATTLAGPLPGDPVDLGVTDPNQLVSFLAPPVVAFGSACDATALGVQSSVAAVGAPSLGNAGFAIELHNGAPNAASLMVLGNTDHVVAGVPLPVPLPGGCPLLVAPDASYFAVTDGAGLAGVSLPVPNVPALVGAVAFVQWLQATSGILTSDAAVIHVTL